MNEQHEGVIQFNLEWQPTDAVEADLSALNAWRETLWKLGLIGNDPQRYNGADFGNVSQRYGSGAQFIISGSQTGHMAKVDAQYYALVTGFDPDSNRVIAAGPVRPSSESMTHGIVYRLDPAANCVMHVHSPELWNAASALMLPQTRPDVAYGTPGMAREVTRLFYESDVRQRGIFAMGGHLDGVIAFGDTAEKAGRLLVETLAKTRE